MNVDEFKAAYRLAVGLVTVYVVNDLDQDVTVQIKGNRIKSADGASNVGSSFTVPAGGADFRTLIADQSGVLPWIFVELSCSTAPTDGSVSVYLVRHDGEEKLVDGLEIRDTDTHSPSTDPDKMKIGRWWL